MIAVLGSTNEKFTYFRRKVEQFESWNFVQLYIYTPKENLSVTEH